MWCYLLPLILLLSFKINWAFKEFPQNSGINSPEMGFLLHLFNSFFMLAILPIYETHLQDANIVFTFMGSTAE